MINIFIFIFILIIIIIIIQYSEYKHKLYDLNMWLLLNIKLLFSNTEQKYLYKNFDKIFTNIENIDSENYNNATSINVCKNCINQYKIINMIDYKYLITNVINYNDVNNNLYKILNLILSFINVNGENIDISRCIIMDLINSNLQLFPSIHTDIEWGLFDNSNCFQVWYLYENNDNVGNMFLIDTEYVIPSTYLIYNSDNTVSVNEQCSDKNIKTYSDKNDLKSNIKYLHMKSGECLIFGKNLYHMSDYRQSSNRSSVNFRVIIKDQDGGIPINLNNNCLYNKNFLERIKNKNIKFSDGKIYPKMFDLLYFI